MAKHLDLSLIEKLASIHCTNTEIASMVDCDPSLLSKPKYSVIIAKGKDKGKMTLRRKMYETAMGGNVTMMIWLSKQILGHVDREVVKHSTESSGEGFKITVEDYTTKPAVKELK